MPASVLPQLSGKQLVPGKKGRKVGTSLYSQSQCFW
jgi:hypothetical protein